MILRLVCNLRPSSTSMRVRGSHAVTDFWRTLLISLRSPRAQPRGFKLRIRETAGTCFALKSMLSRRRHRFQIVFALTCGHQKRFTNGNVWTRINLNTDKYLSVFKFIRIRVDGASTKFFSRGFGGFVWSADWITQASFYICFSTMFKGLMAWVSG